MIQGIYSVKDLKAGAFAPPFFMPRDEAAIRAFGDAVQGGDTLMIRHPEDFALYCLGEFDDNLGLVAGLETPKLLATAQGILEQRRARQPELPLDEALARAGSPSPAMNGAASADAGVTHG